jgi:PAS domain S-box-containing protein
MKKKLSIGSGNEKSYELLFENNPQPMWFYDLESLAFLKVNNAAIQQYGYSNEEFLTMTIKDIRPAEDIKLLEEDVEKTRKVYNQAGEWRHLKKNGEPVYVEIISHSVIFNGRPARHVLVRDITGRKLVENELRQNEERFRVIVEGAPDPIFIQTEMKFAYLNPAACRLFGVKSTEEVVGTRVMDRFHPDYYDKIKKRIYLLNDKHKSVHDLLELIFIRMDGSEVWVETTGEPITYEGKLGGMVFVRDISGRKQAEIELRKLKDSLQLEVERKTKELQERVAELELSNRELDAFSYSVSHDLRSPLRAINGFSKFLMEDYFDKLDDEGKRFLTIIQQNAVKMDNLISDMLDLSRISRVEMKLTTVNLGVTAKKIFQEIATQKEQKYFDLQIEKIPDTFCDLSLIRQVWQNLISNALKYSSKSEIKRIRISAEESETEIIYAIKDSGAGFDPKYSNKLFGVFQRLHSDEEFEGTGVGLAIVQRIVNRHGGKVWAESEPCKGATFYFSLPKPGETELK